MPVTIRPAASADLNRLVEIYNHYVSETHVTFDTEPFAVGARTQWFNQFAEDGPYRLLVAEQENEVIAYVSSTPFKVKPAYGTSVETTIYIDKEHTGHGVGKQLFVELLEQLANEASVHRVYGGIALPNPASIALHEGLGFIHVGSYHEVGYKFGKYWDVNWYEKDVASA